MTDHKFADDDVIKALECCTLGDCFPCAYRNIGVGCRDKMNADALALILRQKAEIDDLKVELDAMRGAANSYKMHYENARAEAIKEFANNVVQELWKLNWHYGQIPCSEEDKTIQRAIKECIAVVERNTKEMTEENK